MNWALIVVVCMRWCEPQYVELYPTRQACVAKLVKPERWKQTSYYCAPVATGESK